MGKREKTLIQQLVTKVIVTPITNKVCTLGHLVTPSTDICILIRDITPCGKGEGLGKRWQYPGPLFALWVSELPNSPNAGNPVSEKNSYRYGSRLHPAWLSLGRATASAIRPVPRLAARSHLESRSRFQRARLRQRL